MAIQALEQKRQYTSNDLWEWAQLPEYDDRRLELIDGEIIVMSPSSARPSMIGLEIGSFIRQYVREHDLGFVSGADGAYELSPGNTLAPDVGFVSKARLPKMPDRFFQLAPDLAVEVVSPTDSIKKTLRKAAKYLAAGTKLVWIFYPDDRTIDVCRPAPEGIQSAMLITELTIDDTLDGGDVLPGFRLPVRDVFKLLETDEPKAPHAKAKKTPKNKKVN
ncbi:MAG: Uma2 family endonuclease [Aggregatilineales bacterium]